MTLVSRFPALSGVLGAAIVLSLACASKEEIEKRKAEREAELVEKIGAEVAGSKWRVKVDTSPMDDSKTVVAHLRSPTEYRDWIGLSQTASLFVRCEGGKTEVFVNTGAQLDIETGNLDGATVRVRLDDAEPVKIRAGKATSGDAAFLPKGASFAKGLIGKKKMVFEFSNFKVGTQIVEFDLEGVDAAMTEVRAACNW